MSIKFVDLLQQSWNFMRNQSAFSLYAIGISVCMKLVARFLFPEAYSQQAEQQQVDLASSLPEILPAIVLSAIDLFISLLMILNIQSINNGQYRHFFQNTSGAMQAFLPMVLLILLAISPSYIGLSITLSSTLPANVPLLYILALLLIFIGIYLLIKLSLAAYVYLLEQPKTLMETIKTTMSLSRGKMMPLVLFVVISVFVPNNLIRLLSTLNNDFIGISIKVGINAVIAVFFAIFSFRFYQVYRRLPANN